MKIYNHLQENINKKKIEVRKWSNKHNKSLQYRINSNINNIKKSNEGKLHFHFFVLLVKQKDVRTEQWVNLNQKK